MPLWNIACCRRRNSYPNISFVLGMGWESLLSLISLVFSKIFNICHYLVFVLNLFAIQFTNLPIPLWKFWQCLSMIRQRILLIISYVIHFSPCTGNIFQHVQYIMCGHSSRNYFQKVVFHEVPISVWLRKKIFCGFNNTWAVNSRCVFGYVFYR